MKKRLALALVIALLPIGLNPVFAAPKQTTITYWTHDNAPSNAFERTLIAQYEAANPKIKINYLPVPGAQIVTKLATSLAGGSGPDLVNVIRRAVPQLASKGLLTPVNYSSIASVYGDQYKGTTAGKKYFDSLFSAKVRNAFVWDKKQVGIPHEVASYTMWTNKSFTSKAGIKTFPRTWDDVIASCKAINDANPGVTALVLPLNSSGQMYQVFDQIVRAAGGKMITSDGRTPSLDTPAVVKSLTLWRDLVKTHKCIDPSIGPIAGATASDLFAQGKSAMNLSSASWYIPYLKTGYPKVYDNYDVGQLPVFNAKDKPEGGAIYSYSLLVPKTSKKSTEAWKFGHWLTSKGQEYFNSTGVWLGDLKTFNSKETANSERWDVFKEAIDTGEFLPNVTSYLQWTDLVRVMIESVILGTVSPADAAKTGQDAAVRLLYN
jgi:ABC-type glycerol-3-phosphate transport system substrate-binding protein